MNGENWQYIKVFRGKSIRKSATINFECAGSNFLMMFRHIVDETLFVISFFFLVLGSAFRAISKLN